MAYAVGSESANFFCEGRYMPAGLNVFVLPPAYQGRTGPRWVHGAVAANYPIALATWDVRLKRIFQHISRGPLGRAVHWANGRFGNRIFPFRDFYFYLLTLDPKASRAHHHGYSGLP